MRHITLPQQKKIHVLARDLGMDQDLLHSYTEMMTGKTSLRELSVMEAVRVIDGMEGKINYQKGDHMSYRQESFIMALAGHLGWVDEEKKVDLSRLNGFVKKYCGIEDYRWLTKKTASNVIEGLKSLLSRQKNATKGS